MTYIYLLLDISTMTGYVGKADDPWKRFKNHWVGRWHKQQQTPRRDWLRSLKTPPQFVILQRCASKSWQRWERIWIRDMREGGLRLRNLLPGGEGGAMSPESRKKQSKSLRAHYATHKHSCLGKPCSKETREKLRLAATSRKQSKETIAKKTKSQTGLKRSPEARRRISLGQMGHPVSEEARARMRLAKKKAGLVKRNYIRRMIRETGSGV